MLIDDFDTKFEDKIKLTCQIVLHLSYLCRIVVVFLLIFLCKIASAIICFCLFRKNVVDRSCALESATQIAKGGVINIILKLGIPWNCKTSQ